MCGMRTGRLMVKLLRLLRGLVGLPGFEPGTSCTPNRTEAEDELTCFQMLAIQLVELRLLSPVEHSGLRRIRQLQSYLHFKTYESGLFLVLGRFLTGHIDIRCHHGLEHGHGKDALVYATYRERRLVPGMLSCRGLRQGRTPGRGRPYP